MKSKQSEEDYLENILILSEQKEFVRSIDIVNYMNFSKPSISIAMHKLKDNDLITMDDDGIIKLTPKGKEIAEKTYEKHKIISTLLMDLGVSNKTALEDACEIEHCLSDETFGKIKEYYYKNKK